MRDSIQSAEKARAAMNAKDFAATEAALKEATASWPQNELATRLQPELAAARTASAAAPPPAESTPIPKTAATHASTPIAAADAAATEAEAKPFLLTPAGAVTVVIGVAFLIAAFNVFKKIKGRANEALE